MTTNNERIEQHSGEPEPEGNSVEELTTAAIDTDEADDDGSLRQAQTEEVKDLQQQADEHEAAQTQKFGTFSRVFAPTLLTILSVIMFLRTCSAVATGSICGFPIRDQTGKWRWNLLISTWRFCWLTE